MDGDDPRTGELPATAAGDPFAIAAQRLKAELPSDEPSASTSDADPIDFALASLDEAEIEIRRARDRLSAVLGTSPSR